MAIMDNKLVLADALSIVQNAAANKDSTVLDLGAGVDPWGSTVQRGNEGGDLWLNVRAQTAIVTASSSGGTVTIDLKTDTVSGFSSATDLMTVVITPSSMSDGDVLIRAKVPTGVERYLKLNFAAVTKNTTAGKVDAWLGLDGETMPPGSKK